MVSTYKAVLHSMSTDCPAVVFAGVSATLVSGIRSVFCYSHVPQIKVWHHQYELESQQIPPWFLDTLEQVDQRLKASGGKVTLGFGFDGYHLPKDDVIRVFEAARKVGVRRITSHWRRNSVAGKSLLEINTLNVDLRMAGSFSVPQILKDLDLLGPDILLSHATGSTDEELNMLTDAGAYISSTPATESQMAHGDVIGFRPNVLSSLGADCESNNPSSILHAMQIGLAVTRSHRNSEILAQGRFPKHVEPTTLHAFNLATIHGARAIGEGDRLGSLREGKQADITIFDTTSPVMTCVADHDPLVAVVRHASPHEVDTVIIGGMVKKQDGKLVDVTFGGGDVSGWEGCEQVNEVVKDGKLPWSEIAKQLRRSRRDVQGRIDRCNVQAAREKVLAMWGMTDGEKVFM